jgi:acid stress-induced BolA-like protein IbaG/YrbA
LEPDAVAALIRAALPDAQVDVSGDGRHFEALVVSPEFVGKPPLARQRLVMAGVEAEIKSGALHALSMRCFTPEEWASRTP